MRSWWNVLEQGNIYDHAERCWRAKLLCHTVTCCICFPCVLQRAVDPTLSSRVARFLSGCFCVCVFVQIAHDSVQCVCVCACAYGHAEMHVWMLYMHVGIWASACAWGLSQVIAHVCSGNCCDVLSSSLQEVFSQLETKQKMTPAYACSSARRCLSLSVPSDASLELNGREVWKMSTSKRVQASTNPQIMTGRPAWT